MRTYIEFYGPLLSLETENRAEFNPIVLSGGKISHTVAAINELSDDVYWVDPKLDYPTASLLNNTFGVDWGFLDCSLGVGAAIANNAPNPDHVVWISSTSDEVALLPHLRLRPDPLVGLTRRELNMMEDFASLPFSMSVKG